MKKVVVRTTVYLDETSSDKGYVMRGNKGDFITARDVNGKFIWVRLTPSKTTKPVHEYNTIQEAIEDKINRGYEVYEYSKAELS